MGKLVRYISSLLRHKIAYIKKIKKILFDDFILIYQMGKVASTTIEKSLFELGIDNLHTHYYSKNAVHYFYNDSMRRKAYKPDPLIRLCFKLRRKELAIITMMRDPIARNISMLFHELPHILDIHITRFPYEAYHGINTLLDIFLEKYMYNDIVTEWFDKELKYYTGINIMDFPFDKEKGYIEINKGKYKLMALTAEKLNSNEEAIGEFLQVGDFKLVHANMASQKWYDKIYSDYKNYHIPTEKQLTYYDSDVVKYFYTENDIDKFKNKWMKNKEKHE